nr:copia protein [Tanacetum cinerariifolium]
MDLKSAQNNVNGNSFKPVPRTTANADGASISTIPGPVTTKEKSQKKNDVKARSMLLMALSNEHLLIFSQYNDAKTLFEAIQARFGSNDATKKTQRTLMKQMYKNFNAPSTESLDSVFNRLQKIISQLAVLVSTVSTPVSIVSSHDNTANLSDATVYAFLANQPNGSQLVHEDLEQIHEDDLEEMDLKWQLALLSMRARRLMNQDSSRKTVIVEDTSSKAMVSIDRAGFDWSYMADDEVPTNMALMAFSDLEHPKFKGYGPKASKNVSIDTSNEIKKALDALIIKDWVFDSNEDESEELNFASTAVLTKSGILPISTARQSSLRAAAPVSAVGPINTAASKPLEHDRVYLAFGGGAKDGKITGKGTIRTGKLDFEDVYFVKELQFNLFSVLQMCDKKNNVLFTDTECFVLSPNFKLADESQDLLKVPRKNNKYRFDIKNIISQKDLTCLLAKATNDESMLWHRRLNQLGKFDGKLDEGIFVGYSTTSKAFRVYNIRTRKRMLKSLMMLMIRDEGAEADYINLEIVIPVSPIPSTIIHKDHPKEHIIREVNSVVHTRKMAKQNEAGLISFINKQRRTNHKDFQNCLFACFLSQMEPKKGHRQEEGIDYDEVFAPVARIEAIRLFLAYASFMDFLVYQMDVKSAFLYATIEEEVYVSQPPGFVDLEFPDRVYKVEKALYGLHQALKPASTPMETHKPLSKDAAGTDKKIHVDNESAICVVKNHVYHSKTKHIEIRHHFIRDSYDERLIEMVKIHIDYNVADLLTKAFDGIYDAKFLTTAGLSFYYWIQLCTASIKVTAAKFTQQMVINSPCLTDKKELAIPGQTATVKAVNDEVRIQALVDGKRVNIKESSIRRILRLDDAEGTSCLTNAEIFEVPDPHHGMSSAALWHLPSFVLLPIRNSISQVASDEPILEKEESSKQGRKIADIDADVEINLEKAQAKAYNLDLDHHEKEEYDCVFEEHVGYKMNYFKGISYDEIKPLFEKHYNYNQAFLNEVNEGFKVPEKKVRQEKEVEVEISKREGESLEQDIVKKQKMEQETEELKKHLQIVTDDDDDVYADATPLASKIPIIDYKIHTERNRPYFKIISADGNYRLFLSFSTMMKNFDREDLESLWKIVKERFKKTEPENYSDFTLEQMVNDVRLEVEDESEMSLELLRLVRRQLNEGSCGIANVDKIGVRGVSGLCHASRRLEARVWVSEFLPWCVLWGENEEEMEKRETVNSSL